MKVIGAFVLRHDADHLLKRQNLFIICTGAFEPLLRLEIFWCQIRWHYSLLPLFGEFFGYEVANFAGRVSHTSGSEGF